MLFWNSLCKKPVSKLGFIALWLFTSCFTLFVAVIVTQQRNELYEQQKKNYPQYEKIENVYQLKK